MMILAVPLEAASSAPVLSGWWRKSASAKLALLPPREVSRFARNSRDWQQLIEMCRVVDTVLVDQETVYAPRHGNDRLLLGLKGSLNEYELDLVAAAFARRPLREGPPRRTRRRRACKLHQGGRSLREGPGPPRAGGHQLGLRQSPGARQRTTGSALVSGA